MMVRARAEKLEAERAKMTSEDLAASLK